MHPTPDPVQELIERLMLRLADYLVYVVEELTSVVQRQIHRLARQVTRRPALRLALTYALLSILT